MRPTSRADGKPGPSDPAIARGSVVAYGINGEVWHLDVGSSHPGAVEGPKGLAVRQLKWYASWVQNVVRQFGPLSSVGEGNLRGSFSSTRGPGMTYRWCSGCRVNGSAG